MTADLLYDVMYGSGGYGGWCVAALAACVAVWAYALVAVRVCWCVCVVSGRVVVCVCVRVWTAALAFALVPI